MKPSKLIPPRSTAAWLEIQKDALCHHRCEIERERERYREIETDRGERDPERLAAVACQLPHAASRSDHIDWIPITWQNSRFDFAANLEETGQSGQILAST